MPLIAMITAEVLMRSHGLLIVLTAAFAQAEDSAFRGAHDMRIPDYLQMLLFSTRTFSRGLLPEKRTSMYCVVPSICRRALL